MLPAIPVAPTARSPDDQGDLPFAAGEGLDLGSMVEQGIHGYPDKVYQHDLHHGPQACHGGSHCRAHECSLTDGGRTNPLFTETCEEVHPQPMNVLSKDHDPRIAGHGIAQCILDGIGKAHSSHCLFLRIQ